MANKTIPQLIETTSPSPSDVLLIHSSGLTKRVQLQNILPSVSASDTIELTFTPSTRGLIGNIKTGSVRNNELSAMQPFTIKGNGQPFNNSPEDLTVSEAQNLLQIDQLSSTVIQLSSEVAGLTVAGNTATIQQLSSSVDQLSASFDTLTLESITLSSSVETLSASFEIASSLVNTLSTSFDTLTLESITLSSSVETLSASLDIVSLQVTTLSSSAIRKFTTNLGDNVLSAFDVSHNLNTQDIITQIYDNTTFIGVSASIRNTDTNTVSLSFDFVPALDELRVVVMG